MFLFFFFNDTATTEIYTLSLHDALPIWPTEPTDFTHRERGEVVVEHEVAPGLALERLDLLLVGLGAERGGDQRLGLRSEEHTSELQSLAYLVCRLLLEKKKRLPVQK